MTECAGRAEVRRDGTMAKRTCDEAEAEADEEAEAEVEAEQEVPPVE